MSFSQGLLLSFLLFSSTVAITQAQAQIKPGMKSRSPSQEAANTDQTQKATVTEEDELNNEIKQNKTQELQNKPAQKQEEQMKEGDAKFGFHFTLGFPTGYGAGLNYLSPSAKWGFGADYSTFATKTGTAPEIKASMTQMKVVARYHPWASAFFTGLYLGTQSTNFEGTDTYLGQRLTAKIEIKNTLVTPHIGWQWLWDSGIMFAMELGAQVNTGASTKFTDPTDNTLVLNDDTYLSDKKKIEDEGKKFGSSTIPHIMLIRLGYMF